MEWAGDSIPVQLTQEAYGARWTNEIVFEYEKNEPPPQMDDPPVNLSVNGRMVGAYDRLLPTFCHSEQHAQYASAIDAGPPLILIQQKQAVRS